MNQKELKKYKSSQIKISENRVKAGYPKEITIVAEGDSWFDYPFKKDILDYLIEKGYAVIKFSSAGDTIENMIWGSAYKKRGDQVTNVGPLSLQETLLSIKKNKPQFVLFSGGGNDIVGEEIIAYLNHANSKPKPDSLINKSVFKDKMKSCKIAIEFFIQAVHKTNPKAHIIMDGYDYAVPNGKGYKFILPWKEWSGPWILPAMGIKAITKKNDQKKIIKYFVDEFNEMLKGLDKKYTYFHHIDLRGKFKNVREWDNEIHLKNAGYKKIAEIYSNKMNDIAQEDLLKTYLAKDKHT